MPVSKPVFYASLHELEDGPKELTGAITDMTPGGAHVDKGSSQYKWGEVAGEIWKGAMRGAGGPKGRQGDLPAKGKPNSTSVTDKGNGNGTIRDYGSDGRAKRDFDFGHDHGSGDPHAHDWDWSKTPPRQPHRPILPGE